MPESYTVIRGQQYNKLAGEDVKLVEKETWP
jgi:hypothetical protein